MSDEFLNDSWERFRKLQYSCPHHGLPDWLLIQTSYDGLTESTRISVDAVAGGALMSREPREVIHLIDSIAQNQQWSGRDNTGAGGGGRFEVDQITTLSAKLDAMQKAFDKMNVKAVDNYQPQPCVMCGDKGHSYKYCPLAQRDEDTEQVNYLNNESSVTPRADRRRVGTSAARPRPPRTHLIT